MKIVDRGPIAKDRGFVCRGGGAGVVEIEYRRRRPRHQISVADDVALVLIELRLILGQLRLRAFQLRVRLARVELEQDVARLDRRAVGDQHLVDRRIDARAQRHGRDRLDRADRLNPPGEILARRLGHNDRDKGARRLARAPPRRGRSGAAPACRPAAEAGRRSCSLRA